MSSQHGSCRSGGALQSLSGLVISVSLLLYPGFCLESAGDNVSSSPVLLSAPDDGCTIFVRAGSEIQVSLSGNATTGYMWEVVEIDEAVLHEIDEYYTLDETDPEVTGSGGTSTFVFETLAEGESTLGLVYIRSWAPDDPAGSFEAHVEVVK
jgi:predicted secreted protein